MFNDLFMSFQLVLPRESSLICAPRQVTFEHLLMFLHVRPRVRALAAKGEAVRNVTDLKVEFLSKTTSWPSGLTPPFVHAFPSVQTHWPLPRVPSILNNSSPETYEGSVKD